MATKKTAKRPAKTNANGTSVAHDKKFSDNGAWVVTFANGSSVKIFRDKEQFSYPVWYVLDARGGPMDYPKEFTREGLVELLESKVGKLKTGHIAELQRIYGGRR